MPKENDLPGQELVEAGLAALGRGEWTAEALLIAIGAPRLRSIGLHLPDLTHAPSHPELALYHTLGRLHPDDTHTRYNALIRRLVSYEHAMERRQSQSKAPWREGGNPTRQGTQQHASVSKWASGGKAFCLP